MGKLNLLGWIVGLGMSIVFLPAGLMIMAAMILYELSPMWRNPRNEKNVGRNPPKEDEVYMPATLTWYEAQYRPNEVSQGNRIKWS